MHAAVNDKGVLERIRPLPIRLSPGIWFNLCKKGGRAKYCPDGDTCTNAHSRAEQDAWNAQLVDPEGDWKISELFQMTLHANSYHNLLYSLCKTAAFLWSGL